MDQYIYFIYSWRNNSHCPYISYYWIRQRDVHLAKLILLFIPILGRRASILSLSWTWLNRLESKMDVDYRLDMNNDFLTIHTSKKNKHMTINETSIKTLFSLPIFIHRFLRHFSPKAGSTMVNAWQELDVWRSKQKKLARIGGRLELIYWIEQSIWRLEVYPMSNCCWHHMVCLSTMA